MNKSAFKKYTDCLVERRHDDAAAACAAFAASLEPEAEREAWVDTLLRSGSKIRYEVFHDLVFPVLLAGFQRRSLWATMWLAQRGADLDKAKTLREQLGGKTSAQLLQDCLHTDRELRIPNPGPSSAWEGESYGYTEVVVSKIEGLWCWDEPAISDVLLACMTPGQRAIWAILNCSGQVKNGGFSQMFYNSMGELAHEALDGFRHIGAGEYADIFAEVYAVFPESHIPKSRRERWDLLDRLSGQSDVRRDDSGAASLNAYIAIARNVGQDWEEQENRFFKLSQSKDRGGGYNRYFYDTLNRYIDTHPQEFFLAV